MSDPAATSLLEDRLATIAEKIVSVANPERIIVFGSQARGTAGEDSDIDLLVIGRPHGEAWSRRAEIGRIHRSLSKVGVPLDILFFTPEEVEKRKDSRYHVIAEALREGRVLYERP